MVRSIEGVWQLFATDDDIRAHRPDTVRQLIDIQIDRFDPNAQHVLEAGSAAGVEFTDGVVAHALQMPLEDVASCCETLADQGRFLRYVGTDRWLDGTLQERYAFVHDSTETPRACAVHRPPSGCGMAASPSGSKWASATPRRRSQQSSRRISTRAT